VANLSNADLSGADLINAHLNGAILSSANLSGANLFHAYLNEAKLSKADMTRAIMGRTTIGNVDLRHTHGLATIQHIGPSTIGIDTIIRSEGAISETFLRGTGATDTFINYIRSLAQTPFNFYSCFISYSSKDETLAKRLHADLQDRGVRCWFAPHDMKIGDKIRPAIDKAIHMHDKLLLILSRASVASDWVEHEVEAALARERKEKRIILFPIRLDEAILEHEYTGWAALVQHERHIGDFTHWTDPQAYEQAFERLLRNLKSESNNR
jgi:hypothetical protein